MMTDDKLNPQERWSIAIGMLGLITTFGIAHFIYTPLLPLMQAELGGILMLAASRVARVE